MVQDGSGPFAIYFNHDRALEQLDGDRQAILFVGGDYDALDTLERAGFHQDAAAEIDERNRAQREAGLNESLNGSDLVVSDSNGHVAGADDLAHTGSGQDGEQALAGAEATEYVAREERELGFLEAVCPFPASSIEGWKLLVTLSAQGGGNATFTLRMNVESVP